MAQNGESKIDAFAADQLINAKPGAGYRKSFMQHFGHRYNKVGCSLGIDIVVEAFH